MDYTFGISDRDFAFDADSDGFNDHADFAIFFVQPEMDSQLMSSLTRGESIFSIHNNLRSLFVPPPGHLHPLDTWRALAMFWIILQHTTLLFAMNAEVPTLRALSELTELRPFYHASFAVDIFF